MSIYEIDAQIEECIDTESGEIIDMERLEALEMERSQKIENVALWIKNLKAEAEAIKAEKQNLDKRAKSAENKAEQLKKYLDYALMGEKYKSAKVNISYRTSTSVEVDLEQLETYECADNYLRYKDPEPNKDAIKEALNHGYELPGCSLVQKTSIQIR